MESINRRQPPNSVRVLHKWIDDHVKATGGAVARTQRWISFMVIASVLDEVRDEDNDPVFVLKGGAAMELRLGLMARATKDFDVSFRQLAADMLSRLDEAFDHPHGDFEITRTPPTPVRDTRAQRLDLKLAYRGRSWQTIQLEIAPAEGAAGQEIDRVPGVPLDHVGLQGIDHVACVSIRYQIAQKLHACTEDSAPGTSNDRSRDLIDLLLLRGLLREADLLSVREACIEIFALRAHHTWPPTVRAFDSWRDTYPREAQDLGFELRDVDQAVAAVNALVDEIDRSDST